MAWIRIDDQLFAHPKIRCAWQADRASIGLHLLALSYAGAYLTDGTIDDQFVREMIPGQRQRHRAITALEHAGLWERNGATWRIHDYLKYNQSRADVLDRRRADSARKARGKDTA